MGCRSRHQRGPERHRGLSPVLGGVSSRPWAHRARSTRRGRKSLRGLLATLRTAAAHTAEIPALLRAALDRFGRPARVVADQRRETELRDALDAGGVPTAATLEVRGMGFMDGGADVYNFRRARADGRVTPAPSLLLRSAMAEARTISDPAGNAKLSKGAQGGRRLRARNDAAAAAILAVAAGLRQPAKPRPRWRYAGMAG